MNRTPFPWPITGRFYYGWIIVGVCFLSWLVADAFGFYTFGLYILPMHRELGWSSMTITGAMTLKLLMSGVLGPAIGFIADKKYGARILMSSGVFAAGATTYMVSYVQKPWQFYFIYGILGAVGMVGFGGLVSHTIIAKWFVRMRGRAMAIAALGVSVSGLIFIPLSHYLIENYGWRTSLRVVGIIILATAFLPALAFMRRRPEDIGLYPDGDTPLQIPDGINRPANTVPRIPSTLQWTVREALKTKSLWILLAAFNLIALCLNGINIHFYPYMEDKGIGTDVAAGAMTVYAVCCALVKIPWGLVAEKFSVRYCVIIVFLGSALGLFTLLWAKTHGTVFAFAVIYGLSLGGMMVLREVIFADYFGHECLGAIRGVVMPINVVFMALSPILASWLYETFDNYAVPYGVFLVNFLLGAFFMLYARPPKKDSP